MDPASADNHEVVAVLFDGFQPLDLTGPMEVLAGASRAEVRPPYRVRTVSPHGQPVTSESGLTVVPDGALDDDDPIDTLLVVGGRGTRAAAHDPQFIAQLDALASRADRITSVCSGALLLAAAGRLNGRSATTHWSAARALARYPDVEVDADRLWVRDGDTWTSAGVTAGIDLYLAIVEADHGADVARLIARWLVVFVQRPGGQDQFSTHLRAHPAESEPIADLQRWIPDHLGEDLTVVALAERAGMSPRTLSRRFHHETGSTPAAFVEAARVEAAKQLLESTPLTIDNIARRVGLHHGETLHRAFHRRVSTTPAQYRHHFTRSHHP